MVGMLETVFKNALGGYATRLHPNETREPFDRARADLELDMEQCKLCGNCARICPSEAVTVDRERREWERDPFSCIYCGDCAEACPKNALHILRRPPGPASGRVRVAFSKPPG